MRKDDIKMKETYLTRYGYLAKIIGKSDRLFIADNGHQKIMLHHSDITKPWSR